MIVSLTKKELEAVEQKEKEVKEELLKATEYARSLRPDQPEPVYADNEKADEMLLKYIEWQESGSSEWKEAYKKEMALSNLWDNVRHNALVKADNRLLQRLSKDQDKALGELKKQVNLFCRVDYAYTAHTNERDAELFIYAARHLFLKITETLDEDHKAELEAYIDKKAHETPKQIDKQIAGIVIDPSSKYKIILLAKYEPSWKSKEHETTGKKGILATRPSKYVTTVDRTTKMIFKNELTLCNIEDDSDELFPLRLDRKGNVHAGVVIDYRALLDEKREDRLLSLPELNQDDLSVHDAIITQLNAGNRAMSYDMLYRAMTGKVTGKITVPDDALKKIDAALDKFRGRFRLEYVYTDEDGKEKVLSYDEPLVTFRRLTQKEKINGKVVAGGIILPDDTKFDPPLLKWARFNGNEIDTRDITLLDVPKINNGDESFKIKMYLYRKIGALRNEFERKYHSRKELPSNRRSIRYDTMYDELGIDVSNKDKRKLLKKKVDTCMSYWKERGFVLDYQHKRDKSAGNTFYAVEIRFLEPF